MAPSHPTGGVFEPVVRALVSAGPDDDAALDVAHADDPAWSSPVEHDDGARAVLSRPRSTPVDDRLLGEVRPRRAEDVAGVDEDGGGEQQSLTEGQRSVNRAERRRGDS